MTALSVLSWLHLPREGSILPPVTLALVPRKGHRFKGNLRYRQGGIASKVVNTPPVKVLTIITLRTLFAAYISTPASCRQPHCFRIGGTFRGGRLVVQRALQVKFVNPLTRGLATCVRRLLSPKQCDCSHFEARRTPHVHVAHDAMCVLSRTHVAVLAERNQISSTNNKPVYICFAATADRGCAYGVAETGIVDEGNGASILLCVSCSSTRQQRSVETKTTSMCPYRVLNP